MGKKKEEVLEETKEEVKEESVDLTPEYYILKTGETLEEVAKMFNLDVKKLKEINCFVVGTNQIKLK